MRKTIICTGISHSYQCNNQPPYGQMVSGMYFNMTRSTGSLGLTSSVSHFWLLLCHVHRQLAEWGTLINITNSSIISSHNEVATDSSQITKTSHIIVARFFMYVHTYTYIPLVYLHKSNTTVAKPVYQHTSEQHV